MTVFDFFNNSKIDWFDIEAAGIRAQAKNSVSKLLDEKWIEITDEDRTLMADVKNKILKKRAERASLSN